MNRVKFVFICIFLALMFNPLFSAEVSEKQDIAIFGLTHYDHDIPQGVLGYTDSSINHIFINLKRFSVIGYGDYRLE